MKSKILCDGNAMDHLHLSIIKRVRTGKRILIVQILDGNHESCVQLHEPDKIRLVADELYKMADSIENNPN